MDFELRHHKRRIQQLGKNNGVHDALPLLLQATTHGDVEESFQWIGAPYKLEGRGKYCFQNSTVFCQLCKI